MPCPASLSACPISRTFHFVPVSPQMKSTETSAVSGRSCALSAVMSTSPFLIESGSAVTPYPESDFIVSTTDACAEGRYRTWMSFFPLFLSAITYPCMARLFASVAPEVNMMSSAFMESSRAMLVRASSSTFFEARPSPCGEDGLPYSLVAR